MKNLESITSLEFVPTWMYKHIPNYP